MKIAPLPLILLCSLLSACSSLAPLHSKPPYSKIVVNHPFRNGDGILETRIDLPAGTYTPLYEDDDGYFYQAPQKLTGRMGFRTLLVDGGLYLEKDKAQPEKLWFVDNLNGTPRTMGFGKRGDFTLQP